MLVRGPDNGSGQVALPVPSEADTPLTKIGNISGPQYPRHNDTSCQCHIPSNTIVHMLLHGSHQQNQFSE